MFAYYFGEFIPGNNISLGGMRLGFDGPIPTYWPAVAAHASELKLLFGPISPVAAIETAFSTQMRDFYINFVNDLNPGCL